MGNDIKVIRTIWSKDRGRYILRREVKTFFEDEESDLVSAYSKVDNSYIGTEKNAKFLDELEIVPQKANPDDGVSSIGLSSKDNKWYGWSHRAYYGFEPGSTIKPGDSGYDPKKGEWTAKTMADAKQMAIDFADSVS